MSRRSLWGASCALVLLLCGVAGAESPEARGLAALVALQDADGAWRSARHKPLGEGPGLTAFALDAAWSLPEAVRRPHAEALGKARAYLLKALGERSAFAPGACSYPTYATAFTLSALVRMGRDEDAGARKRLVQGLLALQLTEALDWRPADPRYGGWGVGLGERAPVASYVGVSTTRVALGALVMAGLGEKHPARRRALQFLKRCQRASGGLAFSPDPAASKNGFTAEDAPAPYGSATVDGVLALAAAGGDAASARRWVLARFDVEKVPGFGAKPARAWPQALRWYWLATAAEALPSKRAAIRAAVLAAQRKDGSWTGGSSLMMEDEPRLATALALRALGVARPAK